MMKKVKEVVGHNNKPLEEIEGIVVFSEGLNHRSRPRLILGIDGYEEKFLWNQDILPAVIKVGDYLRGFYYSVKSSKEIYLVAYEILDSNSSVLTRSTCLDAVFVEDE